MSSTLDHVRLDAPHTPESSGPHGPAPTQAHGPHAAPPAAQAHGHAGHPPSSFEGRSDFAAAPLHPHADPTQAGASHAVSGITSKDLYTVDARVNTYFQRWNYEPQHGERFDPRLAMDLYTQRPHIHDLMLNFKALKHGQVTTDYRGDKSEYAAAMDTLYNSVSSFGLKEVPGTRRVLPLNANEIKVEVDFESKVKPKDPGLLATLLSPIGAGAMHELHERGVPLPGHASLTFQRQDDGSWKVREEILSPRIHLEKSAL